MDIARTKAEAGAEPGLVIFASFQTAGRGRQGRGWFAPPDANVCFTAIGGRVAQSEAWQISLVAGVAIVGGLREITPVKPCLRFPNDIYLDGKKLGGVLIETVPHRKPGYVTPLIGIGINGNIPAADFPPDLRDRATSLLAATGSEHSWGMVSGYVLKHLTATWDRWQVGPSGENITTEYNALLDRSAARLFTIDDAPVVCTTDHIAPDGTVTLRRTDTGETVTRHAAQVILGED